MPSSDDRAIIRKSPVTLRVRGGKKVGSSQFGQAGAFFREEKEDLVFRSSLGAGHSIADHLKWMLGMVQHDAAHFKQAQQSGCDIVLQIQSEAADFSLPPEALLLPHKLHLPMEISLHS